MTDRALIYVGFRAPVALIDTVTSWDAKRQHRITAELQVDGSVAFSLPMKRTCVVPQHNITYMLFAEVGSSVFAAPPADSPSSAAIPVEIPVVQIPPIEAIDEGKPKQPMNRGQAMKLMGVSDPKTGYLDAPCKLCGADTAMVYWHKSHGLEGDVHHVKLDGDIGCKASVREMLARVS